MDYCNIPNFYYRVLPGWYLQWQTPLFPNRSFMYMRDPEAPITRPEIEKKKRIMNGCTIHFDLATENGKRVCETYCQTGMRRGSENSRSNSKVVGCRHRICIFSTRGAFLLLTQRVLYTCSTYSWRKTVTYPNVYPISTSIRGIHKLQIISILARYKGNYFTWAAQ